MRVTLYKCPFCANVSWWRGECEEPQCFDAQRQPIEFAPLPSEETRETVIDRLLTEINFRYTSAFADQLRAALVEIEEKWKP